MFSIHRYLAMPRCLRGHVRKGVPQPQALLIPLYLALGPFKLPVYFHHLIGQMEKGHTRPASHDIVVRSFSAVCGV